MNKTHGRGRDDQGVVALEFVLVGVPVLLIMLISILTVGGYIIRRVEAAGAARDFARAYATLQTPPAAPAHVTISRSGANPCPALDSSSYGTGTVTVTATGSFDIYGLGTKTITEKVTMRCGG